MRRMVVVTILYLLGAERAEAARRPYLLAYDAATVPEGDVELESWLDFLNNPSPANDEWRWWVGARWSPHERVEVSLLTVLTQALTPPSMGGSGTQLWAELLEGRWHALSLGPAGELSLQLDLRIAMANDLPHQLAPSIALSKRLGLLGFTAQIGYAAGFAGPTAETDRYDWIVWSAGAALDVVEGAISPPLQLGVEAFGEQTLRGRNELTDDLRSTANLGPTLSVAKGRLWLTAGALLGLTEASPTVFVRGIVGASL